MYPINSSDEQEQTLSSGSLRSASSLPKGGDVVNLSRLTSEDGPSQTSPSQNSVEVANGNTPNGTSESNELTFGIMSLT
jgi:hypothetical protein